MGDWNNTMAEPMMEKEMADGYKGMEVSGWAMSEAGQTFFAMAVANLFYNVTLLTRYAPTEAYTNAATVYGSNIFKYLEWIYAGMNII